MSVVYREHGGLVVAEHAQDEQAVQAALKQIDDRLILQKHPGPVEGGWVYKVFRHVSDWQPPVPVATWADDHGNPLPLTSGLVDLVNRLRLDAPNKGPDADQRNQQLLDELERNRERLSDAIMDDHKAKVTRFRTTHTMGARPRKRAWQRNQHYPRWLRDVLR